MAFFISIYVIGFVLFLLHLYKLPKKERVYSRVLELFLLYLIVFTIGITSLFAFIGLTFMDKAIAASFGWPSCPFQQELGNVNLAFGVLGILCLWFKNGFWLATVIGFSIWIFADGIHHIHLALNNGDYSDLSAITMMVTDLIIPVILCSTLSLYCLKKS